MLDGGPSHVLVRRRRAFFHASNLLREAPDPAVTQGLPAAAGGVQWCVLR